MPSRTLLVAFAAAAGVLLAGCSSSEKTPAATTPATTAASSADVSSPAPSTSGGSSAATGTLVTVTENEFTIALSQKTFTPGAYTFRIDNAGKFPHNLHVLNAAGEEMSSTIKGGETTDLTVTLAAGSYELFCSVGNHKAQGMDINIQVA